MIVLPFGRDFVGSGSLAGLSNEETVVVMAGTATHNKTTHDT